MSKRGRLYKGNKKTISNAKKVMKGIHTNLPIEYYKKLRTEMLENNIKSVREWICTKIDEGNKK